MHRSRVLCHFLQQSRILWCTAAASSPPGLSPLDGGAPTAAIASAKPAMTSPSESCSATVPIPANVPIRRLDAPEPTAPNSSISGGDADVSKDDELPFPEKGQVLTGKCTNWMSTKGFGFITGDYDSRQYFVHFQSLFVRPGGYHSLINGQQVSFTVDVVPHSVTKQPQLKALSVKSPDGTALPGGPRPDGGTGLVSRTPKFVKEHMTKEGVTEVEENGKKALLFPKAAEGDAAGSTSYSEGRKEWQPRGRGFAGGGGGRGSGGRGNYQGGRPFHRGGGGPPPRQQYGSGGSRSDEGGLSFASFASATAKPKEDNSFLEDVPSLEGFEGDAGKPQRRGGRGGGSRGGDFRGSRGMRGQGGGFSRGNGFSGNRGASASGSFQRRDDAAYNSGGGGNLSASGSSGNTAGGSTGKLFKLGNSSQASAASVAPAAERFSSTRSSAAATTSPPAQPQYDEL